MDKIILNCACDCGTCDECEPKEETKKEDDDEKGEGEEE